MTLRAGGGSSFLLKPAAPGYRRIDSHFCEADSPGRITVGGADWLTPGTLEIDFLDGVITLNGALAAVSNRMFPAAASFLLLSFQISPTANGVALTNNGVNIHASDITGLNNYESAVVNIAEQIAAIPVGTVLGTITPMIKFPVYDVSKITRNVVVIGNGGNVPQIRLLGYWD